eukprot:TRINITY_DN5947_c0_g1_i1.p1 TRINITY_DN5947_c0_g1~~TRINITY_DN5947_c0_g1_i1.p1  ORF type:complete len:690 (+),score=148.92 TRINITY_DN5947_c0_g1_i1:308-2071(+)
MSEEIPKEEERGRNKKPKREDSDSKASAKGKGKEESGKKKSRSAKSSKHSSKSKGPKESVDSTSATSDAAPVKKKSSGTPNLRVSSEKRKSQNDSETQEGTESEKKTKETERNEEVDLESPIFSHPVIAHSVLAFSQHSLLLPYLEDMFECSLGPSPSSKSSSSDSSSPERHPLRSSSTTRSHSLKETTPIASSSSSPIAVPLNRYPNSVNDLRCARARARASSSPSSSSPYSSLNFADSLQPRSRSPSPFSLKSHFHSKAAGYQLQVRKAWSKVNKDLLVFVLFQFYAIARQCQGLIPELQAILDHIKSGHIEEAHVYLIDDLLVSEDEKERKQGQNILFQLKEAMLCEPTEYRSLVRNAIDTVYIGLLSHSNPRIRAQYLLITERIALLLLSKKGLKAAVQMLDTSLRKLVICGEKNEVNLVYTFNLILDFIALKIDIPDSSEDTRHSLLINKYMCIPYKVLNRVNITLFTYIFTNLSSSPSTTDIRLSLLLIIIGRCRDNPHDMEIIGTTFFKNLVVNCLDPHVAFYASQFLLEILKKQQPEQYTSIMDTILQRAIEMNDEALLFNPYLQIKMILKLRLDSQNK